MTGMDLAEARLGKNFYKQRRLPRDGWTNDYDLIQRYVIEARGTLPGAGDLLDTLRFEIRHFSPQDPAQGFPKTSEGRWEELAAQMFGSPLVAARGPLDFAIYGRTRVIIFIPQHFWQFATELPAVTTKKKHDGRYYNLRLHTMVDGQITNETEDEWLRNRPQERCRCISFMTEYPLKNAKHGYCFNVDFGKADSTIPITIDPDIENKGGG